MRRPFDAYFTPASAVERAKAIIVGALLLALSTAAMMALLRFSPGLFMVVVVVMSWIIRPWRAL